MNDKPLKTLPRKPDGSFADKFEANGKTYYIRTPEMGIGFTRYTELLKMTSVVGYGSTLAEQQANWKKVNEMLNKFYRGENNMGQIFSHVQAQANGIFEDHKRVYNYAFWVCCLFIVQKDEDLTQWNTQEQEEKIKDWDAEGYNERDFLACALLGLQAFSKGPSESLQRKKTEEQAI